jgi:hypothetical protein
MKWLPTCKEATELASLAMDKRLPFTNRMVLQLHLAMCKNCTRFNRQLQEMRRQFRVETAADDGLAGLAPEARQRITSELNKKLNS